MNRAASRLAFFAIAAGVATLVAQSGGPECFNAGSKDVAGTIQSAFDHTFALADDQVRSGSLGPKVLVASPNFVILDLNGDGKPDLAALGRYIRPRNWVVNAVPFNFGTPDYRFKTNNSSIIRAGSVIGERIADFASNRQLFLLIILGHNMHCWTQSSPSNRYALANTVPFTGTGLSVYRGKVYPAAAGDGPVIRPPRLKGDAIRITSNPSRDSQIIYWTGKSFNWYPIEKPEPHRSGAKTRP